MMLFSVCALMRVPFSCIAFILAFVFPCVFSFTSERQCHLTQSIRPQKCWWGPSTASKAVHPALTPGSPIASWWPTANNRLDMFWVQSLAEIQHWYFKELKQIQEAVPFCKDKQLTNLIHFSSTVLYWLWKYNAHISRTEENATELLAHEFVWEFCFSVLLPEAPWEHSTEACGLF